MRKWFLLYFSGCISTLSILLILSIIIDPYGFRTKNNKRFDFINNESPFLISKKINLQTEYYLLGTSRTLRINLIHLEKYLQSPVAFLGISGQSFSQLLILVKKLKKQHARLIIGLDPFSLNAFYDQKNQNNILTLQNAIQNNQFCSTFYFLNPSFIEHIFKTIFHNTVLKTPTNTLFTNWDKDIPKNNTYQDIQKKFNEQDTFKQYHIDQNQLIELISLLTEEDTIIIFPHYFLYYRFFKETNIQQKYFKAIEQIALKTQAKIWSFYDINDITKNSDNFDDYGWHFKPKIGDMILETIFSKNFNYGIKLGYPINKKNVQKILQQIDQKEKREFYTLE